MTFPKDRGAAGESTRPAMRRHRFAAVALLMVAALPAWADDAQVRRGAYLASVMDCSGCHTPRNGAGAPIAGASLSGGTIGFEVPGLGAFWPPNLTPHETGLAGWSTSDIVDAIRSGARPDGRMLAPAMPWANYANLTDDDGAALAAYLKSLDPVDHQVPPPAAPGASVSAPVFRLALPGG